MRQSGAGTGYTMSRSEAQRRYQNLITYRVRPLLIDRSKDDEDKTIVMKRLVRECHAVRYESGAVPGSGTREELVDLLSPIIKDGTHSEELTDWVKRVIRAFGATYENFDD
jgi:hypothetical protein